MFLEDSSNITNNFVFVEFNNKNKQFSAHNREFIFT